MHICTSLTVIMVYVLLFTKQITLLHLKDVIYILMYVKYVFMYVCVYVCMYVHTVNLIISPRYNNWYNCCSSTKILIMLIQHNYVKHIQIKLRL